MQSFNGKSQGDCSGGCKVSTEKAKETAAVDTKFQRERLGSLRRAWEMLEERDDSKVER